MSYTKIVILGSNSFAGSTFARFILDKGYHVLGINRSSEGSTIFLPYLFSKNKNNYKFLQADLNTDLTLIIDSIYSFKPQIIVDFAGQGMVAESWDNPSHWYNTNITSKVLLHDELRKFNFLKKYIRVSTPEVYGSIDHKIKESWELNPSTPYAVSHAAIDLSLRAFYKNYNFPVVFTKFANFYGAGQQLYRIVPRTIIYALTNKKLNLHGGGKSIRAFIHHKDFSDALFKVINRGQLGEIYHFSPDQFHSIKDVVEIICDKLKIPFNNFVINTDDRPGKDMFYLMDSTKAREKLKWTDSVQLEEGIIETINWVKSNIKTIINCNQEYFHKK